MDIFVYSRYALDAATPHEVPHVIVSIASSTDDPARLRRNPECRAVLRLVFADAESPSEQFPESVLFSVAQANEIWDFVERHRSEIARLVVHCDAGMSRSPAVAAAIAKRFTGDDASYFAGRYRPNERVYRTLLAVAEERDALTRGAATTARS